MWSPRNWSQTMFLFAYVMTCGLFWRIGEQLLCCANLRRRAEHFFFFFFPGRTICDRHLESLSIRRWWVIFFRDSRHLVLGSANFFDSSTGVVIFSLHKASNLQNEGSDQVYGGGGIFFWRQLWNSYEVTSLRSSLKITPNYFCFFSLPSLFP